MQVFHLAPVIRHFEPVGRWYESRARHVRLLSGSSGGGVGGESEEEEGEEGSGDEVNPLFLDPTQWKVYTCLLGSPYISALVFHACRIRTTMHYLVSLN